jgi:putative transposase
MAQSLSNVLVHFIVSTKNRFAFLADAESRRRMHAYKRDQQEHHRARTCQEEYLEFLREYQVPYNERYIWS